MFASDYWATGEGIYKWLGPWLSELVVSVTTCNKRTVQALEVLTAFFLMQEPDSARLEETVER